VEGELSCLLAKGFHVVLNAPDGAKHCTVTVLFECPMRYSVQSTPYTSADIPNRLFRQCRPGLLEVLEAGLQVDKLRFRNIRAKRLDSCPRRLRYP
jgi:hypothetical protein